MEKRTSQGVGGWMGGEWGRDWIRIGIMTHNSAIYMKIYNIYEDIYGNPLPFIVTKSNSKESKIILKFMGAQDTVQLLRELAALMTRVCFPASAWRLTTIHKLQLQEIQHSFLASLSARVLPHTHMQTHAHK